MGEHQETVEWLALLRPGGPWALAAIEPDGKIETMTARCRSDIPAAMTTPIPYAVRSDPTSLNPSQEDKS